MNRSIVINAGELITCSGRNGLGIIENGAVVIEKNLISDIGRTDEILSRVKIDNFDIIDARGKPVLPGFIDSHTHFVFGGYRAEEFNLRLQGVPYVEIMERGGGIVNTVDATRKASITELKRLAKKRLDLMLSQGVTTVEGKTGYGLDLETELKQLKVMEELNQEHSIDIVRTFLGAHAVPEEYKEDRKGYIDLLIKEMLPAAAKEGAEFCDVFCDQGAFSIDESRRILSKAQKLGLKSKIHADEIAPLGGAELAAEIGAVSADHLLKVSKEGINKMLNAKVVPVLLPLTAFSLRESYAPARKMIDSGLKVALATDLNPGSAYSGSIPLLFALGALYMEMTVEEIILGMTINAASALDREKEIGSIEIGKKADLVMIDAPSYTHLVYHLGINNVDLVIKDGKVVYSK